MLSKFCKFSHVHTTCVGCTFSWFDDLVPGLVEKVLYAATHKNYCNLKINYIPYSVSSLPLPHLNKEELEVLIQTWVSRVAALTKVLARASGETRAEGLLHEIASWWLFACGILYIVAVSFLSTFLKAMDSSRQCDFSRTNQTSHNHWTVSYIK